MPKRGARSTSRLRSMFVHSLSLCQEALFPLRSGAGLWAIVLGFTFLCGCRSTARKEAPPAQTGQTTSAGPTSSAANASGFTKIQGKVPTRGSQDPKDFQTAEGLDIFDLRAHPDAIVVKPLDPASLTESEQKYGRSPHPDPKVEYQPGIILMEQGDRAIQSISPNGLLWNFDADAPHVNEFEKGKIVFATSRAVGKILYLKRQGKTVTVVLGPIQITDVIRKGEFAMNAPLDLSKTLPFVMPEFPQTKTNGDENEVAGMETPDAHSRQTIVFSRISPSGKWTPVSMAKISPDGRRSVYEKVGRRWNRLPQMPALDFAAPPAQHWQQPPMLRAQDITFTTNHSPRPGARPQLRRAAYQVLPGTGLSVPTVPYMPDVDIPNLPNIPSINLSTTMRATAVGTWNSIGVKWSYARKGVGLSMAGIVQFDGANAAFFLQIGKAGRPPIECGINISASISVHLQLKAHTTEEYNLTGQNTKRYWMPATLSIPLSGNVPLAVNFDQDMLFKIGMSAKNAVLFAEGIYTFTGGIKAGYYGGQGFRIEIPTGIVAKTDIAKSAQGVSVGINDLVLSAGLRTTAGLGAGGFATGVYADLYFTGTILKSPDIGFPCRSGTVQAWLYPGIGYSLPGWLTDAVNAVLSFLGGDPIEKVGTFLQADGTRLWHGDTSIPSNCATPK
jgi:hypothetical protein